MTREWWMMNVNDENYESNGRTKQKPKASESVLPSSTIDDGNRVICAAPWPWIFFMQNLKRTRKRSSLQYHTNNIIVVVILLLQECEEKKSLKRSRWMIYGPFFMDVPFLATGLVRHGAQKKNGQNFRSQIKIWMGLRSQCWNGCVFLFVEIVVNGLWCCNRKKLSSWTIISSSIDPLKHSHKTNTHHSSDAIE